MSYETDLQNDPVGLAKSYSFFPGNQAGGFKLDVDTTSKKLKGDFAEFNRMHVKDDKMIAKVTIDLALTSRGESLVVTPTLDGHTGVPVYFLPWDPKGAAVRMKIPDLDPGLPEDQHPKIFFTAVLSGCAIIFKGTAQNPTIYHCGTAGSTGGGAPTSSDRTKYADSNAFFTQMLSGRGYRGIGGIINSTDYMVTKTGGAGVTGLENRFLAAIKSQDRFQHGFILKSVVSWGSCFGVRAGRDWKFYLQENGTITYDTFKFEPAIGQKQVEKKTFFGKKTVTVDFPTTAKVVRAGRPISRPILVRKVFPGVGTAKQGSSWDLLTL